MKKYFATGVVLSLLLLPTISFAEEVTASNYSEDQIMMMIAKLQKQLEEIRKNNVQCNVSSLDLSLGDGESEDSKIDVKSLQNLLKEKGYFTAVPTGYFGKVTRNSLMNFQKSSGLTATGELDSQTRTYIKGLKCRKDYFVNKIRTEIKQEIKTEIKNINTSNSARVSSISITADGKVVKWSTQGYSKEGFKVVWSKNSNPTYPTRNGDKYIYLSEPSASTAELDAFDGAGTYKVRVCEYLGGSCGVYSNEISVSF